MATYSHGEQMAAARSMLNIPEHAFQRNKKTDQNRVLELPHSAYVSLDQLTPAKTLPRRGDNFNTAGKKVTIKVNQFKVNEWPHEDIPQFDVKFTPAMPERVTHSTQPKKNEDVIAKLIWECPQVKMWREQNFDAFWIWDGKAIAWNKNHMRENANGQRFHSIRVDLDLVKNQPSRTLINPNDESNVYFFQIRQVHSVKMSAIQGFLTQRMDFTNDVYEAINFLDHVLRQMPSRTYTQIKRNFFTQDSQKTRQDIINTMMLDETLEFVRGVYASIRLCHRTIDPATNQGHSTGLGVNLDVANGIFWASKMLDTLTRDWCKNHCERSNPARGDNYQFAQDLKPIKNYKIKAYVWSEHFKELRQFHKLKITLKHRGKNPLAHDKQVYSIKRFVCDDQHMNDVGANSKNTTFEWKNRATGQKRVISVYDYMKERYGQTLASWQLPLLETAKNGFFPMELCQVVPNQRFPYKTNPEQTAKMIKFAVQRPKDRLEAIQHGIRMLKWNIDPFMKHYGLNISMELSNTNCVIIRNPELKYGSKVINPGTAGRWNINGVRFLKGNTTELRSWGVGVINDCVDKATVENFIRQFVNVYVGHGGKVVQKVPCMMAQGTLSQPEFVAELRMRTGNLAKSQPQILMMILPEANSETYGRLKKNMDCRWGIQSQFVRVEHVKKAAPQYCSNVAMKFNAKLGGTTNMVAGREKDGSHNFFKRRTMIIGADVSHPTHGSPIASMAALTMSADPGGQRYWAACQTNGKRLEIIKQENIQNLMMGFFPKWMSDVGKGKGPEHIYYFRDGVSEGQYAHVLEQEVHAMKAAILTFNPNAKVVFTVIVCSKRHKIRFFPNQGDFASDGNGNPLPGTLVERDVTHPFENDFYLCSHTAIQGTARPVHYHVLLDEANVKTNDLQQMIYHHCYQFMRSTTPVSIHPAVYYAHLAASRCRAHETVPEGGAPRYGEKFEEYKQDKTVKTTGHGKIPKIRSQMTEEEQITEEIAAVVEKYGITPPLMTLGFGNSDKNGDEVRKDIKHSMWYI